ncbi:MAG: p-hydroxycinnamoyl CoA hydratase/lyase [Rhodospirillaceae bacterium]|nr:p-hydroxycinnamoyl CoA hydratase/lyase [Rhodospirillaceae bacterium]
MAARKAAKKSAKRAVKKTARRKAAPNIKDPVFETVKIERDKGITFLIMNRPEKRNAMSPQLHLDMNDAIDHLSIDPYTDVLVLTGAGKAFCAGQDIRLYFRGTADDPAARAKARRASNDWRWQKLSKFPKPTIAMVNGFCFGGAFTQVCACDFAIASNSAVFGLSEVNWGIIPGGIVSWNVGQVMNMRDAIYYATTGEPFKGKRAMEIGLVNKSVPAGKLKSEVMKLARLMQQKSPAAVKYTKEAIRSVRYMNEPEAADYLNAKSDALKYIDKEDSRGQGMSQFLDEKSYRPGLGHFERRNKG